MNATAVMARTLNLAMSSPISHAPKVASQIANRFVRNQALRKTCGHLLEQAVCSKRCAGFLFERNPSPQLQSALGQFRDGASPSVSPGQEFGRRDRYAHSLGT